MDYRGGCQCGAIRYRAEGPRDRASVCYCRMCQKASGAPFMAFVRFRVGQVHWDHPPAIFASSNIVERGFCPSCGTPLSYRRPHGDYISLTIHSLDEPTLIQPELAFSTDRMVPWCRTLASLPTIEMEAAAVPDFLDYQWSDRQ